MGSLVRPLTQERMVSRAVWNDLVCIVAAKYGRLEVLKWACLNGLQSESEWDEYVCWYAVENNQVDVLEWLKKIECPCGGKYHIKMK